MLRIQMLHVPNDAVCPNAACFEWAERELQHPSLSLKSGSTCEVMQIVSFFFESGASTFSMKFRACSFEWFPLSEMYIQFACWAVIWDYMAEFYKIPNPSTPFICCVHCCGVGVVKQNRTKFYFQNLLSNWGLPVRIHCLGTENGMTKKLQTKKRIIK